jgi:2-keto-4-pentenoate hydratase
MSKKKINKPTAARPHIRALNLTRPLSTLPLRPLIGPAQGRLRPPVAAVAAAARLKASQTATAASSAAIMQQPPSKPKTAGAPKLKSVVSDAVRNAAAAIRSAYENQKPIPPIRDMLPPNDLAAAYAVQQANTNHWIGQGRRPVGRKIGLTAKAVQAQLGVDQPDYGILYADMEIPDSEEIPTSRVMQPRAEAEVALVLKKDLLLEQLTLIDLIDAVAYALPAIEVVGSRIAKWDIKIVDTVADNASSGLFVLGTKPVTLDRLDLRNCGMVLEKRGDQVSVGAGVACLSNPLNAALWLARKMVTVGMPLRAGNVILTGALGPMAPVAPGDVLEARISGLGSVRAVFAA